MTNQEGLDLIYRLSKVKGALDGSGECSVQTLLPLEDGTYLRVGMTDDDVADKPGIWWDCITLNNSR